MRLPRFSKKFVALGAVVGITMGASGIAAAYFSTTGTGTGSTSVGSINTTGTFTVSAGTASFKYKTSTTPAPTGLLPSTPGTTNESYGLYTWTVTNKTEAVTHLATVAVSIDKAGTTAEYTSAGTLTTMTGCKASWFAIGTGTAAPATSNTDSTTMTVTLTGVTLGPHSNATSNNHTGTYTVQLVNATTATQATCQADSPAILVHASSS